MSRTETVVRLGLFWEPREVALLQYPMPSEPDKTSEKPQPEKVKVPPLSIWEWMLLIPFPFLCIIAVLIYRWLSAAQ